MQNKAIAVCIHKRTKPSPGRNIRHKQMDPYANCWASVFACYCSNSVARGFGSYSGMTCAGVGWDHRVGKGTPLPTLIVASGLGCQPAWGNILPPPEDLTILQGCLHCDARTTSMCRQAGSNREPRGYESDALPNTPHRKWENTQKLLFGVRF